MNNNIDYYFTLLYFNFTLILAGLFTLLFTLHIPPIGGYSKVKIEEPEKTSFYFTLLYQMRFSLGGNN